MGATARCRGSLEPSPRAPGDGREPLACAPSRRKMAEPKKSHSTEPSSPTRVNEMWGTDMSQTVTIEEGRAYVFVAVEHANSEIIGIHAARSANRFEALEPVRQGCIGTSAPSRPAWRVGSSCVTIRWLQLHIRRFPDRDQMSGHRSSASFVREPEGKWRRRALHPNLEGELALGADVQNHRGTARRSSSHSPGATMKLGSSRGMDTKKTPPRGSREEQNHATNCD